MWHLTSRVHRLNQFPNHHTQCYVKRDDELGCGINGTKLRKYASLMPTLMQRKIKHLIIIAGPQSNNLLAALQMAREFQLQVSVFLLKPKHLLVQGNYQLSLLFLQEHEIFWLERHQWVEVDDIAQRYSQTLPILSFVLKEGASVLEALPGAMSLADDILRNEHELKITFNHIFIDAGTGFSAAALIEQMSTLQHKALIHVLLLADDKAIFMHKLHQWTKKEHDNYQCFQPYTAKSFGSVNQTIKDEIKRLACEEGILADPIYMAKLFHAARKHLVQQQLQGKVLIIHSGGTLTMPGFSY